MLPQVYYTLSPPAIRSAPGSVYKLVSGGCGKGETPKCAFGDG